MTVIVKMPLSYWLFLTVQSIPQILKRPCNQGAEGSIPWRESSYFSRHISEMENGKRPIGKLNARKLADSTSTRAVC